MLKRKYSNKPDYKHTAKYQAKTEYVNNPDFNGYVTIFRFDEVQKPLITTYNHKEYCLADSGYIWLQTLPTNEKYCLTTLIDNKLNIIEWYFDVIKNQGLIDGIPYFDDLYLDVVVSQINSTYLLDEDELQDALDKNIITKDDYNNAYIVAHDIIENKTNIEHLINFSFKYLHYMLEKFE
ncbi:MAG: hypothetical protein K0Q49_1783 [Haloplasmataceae bacterium]|jgi:predicted RNA-binding protein associated with RNAse of E/G family|nr:hypothetical protein [Haloplasmataceae bacterium]